MRFANTLAKTVVASLLLAAASLSHAAYSKSFSSDQHTLFAFDTFSSSTPFTLSYSATPSVAGGQLESLFGVLFLMSPTGTGQSLVSQVFSPGAQSFSGSFFIPEAGTYSYAFSLNKNSDWLGSFNLNVAPVPEPETVALMGIGLMGVLLARRRKRG
ncbi:hypothetical protein IGB42_00462 [Andreprevotia sp. IGB-42]|nr:PEP-CTERM sorting domain-containing protein [Andreprevotia sp. IGB-42]KAF0815381.1 hypothetical protein IGB42_00462 [Andreprevotia sp. IGB-42]